MEDNQKKTEATIHVSSSDKSEFITVNLEDLDDDQLLSLYEDANLEEARFVLRERTGSDPAVTLWNMTPDDVRWSYDWKVRNGKLASDSADNDRA
jgi:hypothetical protein